MEAGGAQPGRQRDVRRRREIAGLAPLGKALAQDGKRMLAIGELLLEAPKEALRVHQAGRRRA